MTYLIYARKYRPKTFEEMVGQKALVQTLKNAIKNNRVAQAYIFSGMRGVGKTTAARILAKSLNCQQGPIPTPCNKCEFCRAVDEDRSIDVLEIDGASNRGIDEVRSLREGVKYKPIQSRNKVIIIDEVHMLTDPAFNALLKTLEEPPSHTVFIFATTEYHKIPATIKSRCQHFEFKKISQKDIVNHLLEIAQKEKITISSYGLSLIAEAADGSLRDAQSLLDQAVAFCGEVINDEDLKEILGTISREILFEFSSMIVEERSDRVFALVDNLIERGYDLRFFYKELVQHFRNLLLVKSIEKPQELIPLNEEEINNLKKEAAKASSEDILRYLSALQQGEQGLKFSSHPRIYLETLLVKLCHFKKLVPIENILKELEGFKKGITPSPRIQRDSAQDVLPQSVEEKELMTPKDVAVSRTESKNKAVEEKNIFKKIISALQKEKSSLAAILSQHSSFKLRDELQADGAPGHRSTEPGKGKILEISFSGGKNFYMETIKKEIKLVEKVSSEVVGEKIKVKLSEEIVEGSGKREKEIEAALKDPNVQYFMDLFKAQVISVEPIKRAKDRE
ncbi:MAG: DNA polymerase III subunit gamma/tau [Candidatus Aminicenantaceae bacterium]